MRGKPRSSLSFPCRAACRGLPNGACVFASSAGAEAFVFWSPRQCAHVLPVAAVSSAAAEGMDLRALSCRAVVLVEGAGGDQHVLLQQEGHHLQLALTEGSLLQPARLLTDAVFPVALTTQRLNALACLNHLHVKGKLSARYFPVEPRHRRMCFALRALDGALAGATHRDIAAALFGHARVQADWNDPGDHLRDRIRRAIRRGHSLMNGGYRRLLV
ncbi:DUF2285 domain-containing protein [Mesorhizobium sp. M8A.F.Ca.ET.059.01.1.1]|nr:DUF2285 domain-containing protein [Mesorhizobium sp. M8A.F.Ca.ET.059.01.1.1]